MLKKLELSIPTSCLNKAGADEPIFVLRAKDPLAPEVVKYWAELALQRAIHEPERYAEALNCAERMIAWRVLNILDGKEAPNEHRT